MYIEKNNTLQIIRDHEKDRGRELPAGTQAALRRRETSENERDSLRLVNPTDQSVQKDKTRRVEVIRAQETWQQAAACYVRIQSAAGRSDFSLQELFDDQDGPKTKYILILADGFPTASGRIYRLDKDHVMMDHFAVLPGSRGIGYGRLVMREAERWAIELGYKHMVLKGNISKISFYEQLGYMANPEQEEGELLQLEKDLTKSRKKKKKK